MKSNENVDNRPKRKESAKQIILDITFNTMKYQELVVMNDEIWYSENRMQFELCSRIKLFYFVTIKLKHRLFREGLERSICSVAQLKAIVLVLLSSSLRNEQFNTTVSKSLTYTS